MNKYFCPSCGKEVRVTRPTYSDEVIVTCNTCLINARGFDDKVLDLFDTESDRVLVDCRINFVKSFAKNQEDIVVSAFEQGRRSRDDEDYKQTRFNF